MKPGQRSYIPGAGYIQVADVDEVELASLTDEDARLDGFDSAVALRREIEQLYPKELAAGHRAFRIRFTVLPSEVQQQIREEKKQRAVLSTGDDSEGQNETSNASLCQP